MTALINLAWFLLVWLLAGITVLVWWYIAGRALDVYAQRRRALALRAHLQQKAGR